MVQKDAVLKAVKEAIAGAGEKKFKQSVELAINLKNVDLSVAANRVDEEVLLPKGRGRDNKVGIFASGEMAVKARGSADVIVQANEIDDLAGDKRKAKKLATRMNFFLAETPMMATIGKTLGTVLGPRGKMPKPMPPNADPATMVKNLKQSIRVRSKDRRTFHAPVGTADMTPEDLTENIVTVMARVEKKLERGDQNLAAVYVKTTMGPAIRIV